LIITCLYIVNCQVINQWFTAIGMEYGVSASNDPCRLKIGEILVVNNLTTPTYTFTRSISNSISYANKIVVDSLQFQNIDRATNSITSETTDTGINIVLSGSSTETPPYDLSFALGYRIYNMIWETPTTNIVKWQVSSPGGPEIPVTGGYFFFPENWVNAFPGGLNAVNVTGAALVEFPDNLTISFVADFQSTLNITAEFPKMVSGCVPLSVPPQDNTDSPQKPRSNGSKTSASTLLAIVIIFFMYIKT
jgi:hypothetical protein